MSPTPTEAPTPDLNNSPNSECTDRQLHSVVDSTVDPCR